MQLVMCSSCGHFQPATRQDDTLEPLRDDCEKCGDAEFLDTGADDVIHSNA